MFPLSLTELVGSSRTSAFLLRISRLCTVHGRRYPDAGRVKCCVESGERFRICLPFFVIMLVSLKEEPV
jgi:hypothetical protein